MNPKEQYLDFLRHYRHDWLNHIQIMKGYLSMGKLDDLDRFLDHIIIEAQEESRIFLLGHTDLVFFLLTYNLTQDKIMLDTHVEWNQEEVTGIGKQYPFLWDWVQEVTSMIEAMCLDKQENRLFFLFQSVQGQWSLCVEFEGSWNQQIGEQRLRTLQELVTQDQGKLILKDHQQHALSFEMLLHATEKEVT